MTNHTANDGPFGDEKFFKNNNKPAETVEPRYATEAQKAKPTFKKKDADALESSLAALGIEVRYNLRSMRAEFRKSGRWANSTDRLSAARRREIAEKFSYTAKDEIRPLRFSKDLWDEHLNAMLHFRERDPFRDWLKALPTWDGTARLEKLLTNLLGAAEGRLTYWASAYLILGPIQRTYEPGGLLREIPILIGKQRTGKSQLLRNLLPQDAHDWFSDHLNMSESSKKQLEAVLGRVLVELSELAGFRRADLESLKSFISRRDDGAIRLSYRRDPELALRRFAMVGTSDLVECLPNDPAGNTRYVPILCKKGSHVERYLNEHREQLWAEGMALYHDGGKRANMPRDLMELQAEHGEIHRRKDQIVEDAIENVLGDGPFTTAELCSKTNTDKQDNGAVYRLAAALRLGNWSKKRSRQADGKRAHMWHRPQG